MTTLSNTELADLLGVDMLELGAICAPPLECATPPAERDALGWALYLEELQNDAVLAIDAPACLPSVAAPIIVRGKGGQCAARSAGALYLIQTDPRGPANAFHGYRTAAERDAAAAELSAQAIEVVERVDGFRPARPYIDVDAPADATAEELASIADAFTQHAADVGAPADRLAPIVNACDREAKRSRHLIADGWALPDGGAVQLFASDVRKILADAGSRAAEWVDRSGGRNSYGLRVAGCPKARDASAVLSGPLTWLQTDGDTLVIPPAAPVAALVESVDAQDCHTIKPMTVLSVDAEAVQGVEDPQAVAPQTPLEVASFLARFLMRVAVTFAGLYEVDQDATLSGATVKALNRLKPDHCEACGCRHDRAGAYISRTPDGSLFMRCRRTPPGGPALLTKIVKKAKALEPAPDDFDDLLLGGYEIVGGPNLYNLEAIGDGSWDLYAASAWGTGKSVHNAAIVRALLAKNPNAVIVIVSSRKSLSAQLAHDIKGAVSYDHIRGNLDPTTHPVSVWQVDSLARIGPKVVPDLVIIDELSQLTAHAWQGGNSAGKAAAGVSSLRALVQRAGRVIVSDNDLTAAQVEAFTKLRPGKAYRVVRNAFQPWAARNTAVNIFEGKGAPATVRAKLWDFLDEQRDRRAAGLPWEAAAAPCHSLKIARGLAEEATQRYGADAVRLYSSETGDEVKRRDFADAGTAWDPADGSGPMLIVFTSTVSVGVSCPSKRFTNAFAFFKEGNCAATQSAQMLFRCRELTTVAVSYDGKARHDLPQQPRDLFRWVVDARNLAALPDAFRHDRNPFIKTPTASDPDALGEALRGNFEGALWVANSLEVNRSARWFVPRLRRIIERAGMTVTVEKVGKLKTGNPLAGVACLAEMAEVAAGGKRAELMAGEMMRRHAVAVEATERNQDLDDDQSDKTEADKAGDRARFIARDLGISPETLAAHFTPAEMDAPEAAPEAALEAAPDAAPDVAPEDDPEAAFESIRRGTLADWIRAYEHLAGPYRRACRVVDVDHRGHGAPARTLATRSELEADELIRETFRALGAEPCAPVVEVAPALLLSPGCVDLAKRINSHASRLFDDNNSARRSKGLTSPQVGRRRQTVASSLNAALTSIGATLFAKYDTEREKDRGTPSRFVISWALDLPGLPEPRPAHPTPTAKPAPPPASLDADACATATAAAAEAFASIPAHQCGSLETTKRGGPLQAAYTPEEEARQWVEREGVKRRATAKKG
jgi:hypothetical protein